MENGEYSTTYLKHVVARVDFAVSLKSLGGGIPSSVNRACMESFPSAEPKSIKRNKFVLRVSDGQPVAENEVEDIAQYTFYGKDREKRIVLTQDFVLFDYQREGYHAYAQFRDEVLKVINAILDAEDDPQTRRIGLRYVNEIALQEANPTDWGQYLSPNLLGAFSIPTDRGKISRAFHTLELSLDNMRIAFKYGMHNPDYPAVIRQKAFILDLDAYYEGLVRKTELPSYFDSFHSEMKPLFEGSITEQLRGRMQQ